VTAKPGISIQIRGRETQNHIPPARKKKRHKMAARKDNDRTQRGVLWKEPRENPRKKGRSDDPQAGEKIENS